MALTFNIKIPKDQLTAYTGTLKKLKTELLQVASESLYESCLDIMADSQDEFAPRMTSTLASSGTVDIDTPATATRSAVIKLGYGGPAAPYALAVHENPRSGKTGGVGPPPAFRKYKNWARTGQWKYLETPLLKNTNGDNSKVAKKLVRDMNSALKKLSK